ncbi:hypothetical protein [Catellatospora sp. NPDC049133]|uniref:hypothetical protein n=1 Tax=Catellatospora sp. NPDC049133 TaxID=3155499 RepID=UPI00340FA777
MLGPLVGDASGVVLLDGQALQAGAGAVVVVDEPDLLRRCDDELLQTESCEQLESESCGFLRAAPECFVDDDEPEGVVTCRAGVEAVLVLGPFGRSRYSYVIVMVGPVDKAERFAELPSPVV